MYDKKLMKIVRNMIGIYEHPKSVELFANKTCLKLRREQIPFFIAVLQSLCPKESVSEERPSSATSSACGSEHNELRPSKPVHRSKCSKRQSGNDSR